MIEVTSASGSEEARKRVLRAVRDEHVETVYLQFTDIPGAIKSLAVPASQLPAALSRGVWFDGSSVEGLARVVESDLYLRPDLTTFAPLPWESSPAARLICDLCLPDGSAFPADPRGVLRAAMSEAADLGYDYRVSCEVEYFVFEDAPGLDGRARLEPTPVDRSSYFELSPDRATALTRTATQALVEFGIPVQGTHHEVAPGQHEIDLAEMNALAAADAIAALKWALRAIGRRARLLVSFMPKPLTGESGSGLHVAQMLVDRATGEDAFLDRAAPYQLSAVGCHFLAGQLAHARGLSAVVAPLVNSYKRLTSGDEAPACVSWARLSRGALIRVPDVKHDQPIRLEFRASDPACNPYLALAVLLRAGLDGIAAQTPLPPAEDFAGASGELGGEEAVNALPRTLGEALDELEWDPVVRATLGDSIYDRFLTVKQQEWVAFSRHVSVWELSHYLESA